MYQTNWFLCGESLHQKRREEQTFNSLNKDALIHSLSLATPTEIVKLKISFIDI